MKPHQSVVFEWKKVVCTTRKGVAMNEGKDQWRGELDTSTSQHAVSCIWRCNEWTHDTTGWSDRIFTIVEDLRFVIVNIYFNPQRQSNPAQTPRYAMQIFIPLSYRHCSLSSASSTVTVRLVAPCPPELLLATAELEPSASFLSGTLPKLQLDSSELGSGGFGDELVVGRAGSVGAEPEEELASGGCDGCGAVVT
jgi:hypothetical protein